MYLKYNNVEISEIVKLTNYSLNLIPDISNNQFENKILTISYYSENKENLSRLAKDIAQEIDYFKLYFQSNDKYYEAKLSSASLNNLKKEKATGTLEFLLKNGVLISDVKKSIKLNIVNNKAKFTYDGSYKTYPVFRVDFKNNSSFLQIQDIKRANKAILLGNTGYIEDLSTNTEKTLISTTDFSGFTYNNITAIKEDANIQGTVKVDEKGLTVDDYYNFDTRQFYGPAFSKEVEISSNFKAKAFIDFGTLDLNNVKNNILEFSTFDETNKLIAGIQISDVSNTPLNSIILKTDYAEIVLDTVQDNSKNINEIVEALGKWNNFKGYFEIEKMGSDIKFRITKLNDLNENIVSFEYVVTSPHYLSQKLKKIGFVFLKYKNNDVLDNMFVKSLELKSYSTDSTNIDNIFKTGYSAVINNEDSTLFIDNIKRLDLVDIASNFFPLAVGENELLILSNDSEVDVTVDFYEKYLY